MSQYQVFETDRLYLRPTQVEDAAFVMELLNSPKWIKYIGDRNIKTIEAAENYIKKKMLPQLEKLGFTNNTVIRKSDNAKIGSCGLYDRPGLEGVDLGFAFLPAYEGQGYGYESATIIKNAAFDTFNLKSICAITIEENLASRKLIEKLGFTFIEKIRVANDDEELMKYVCNASV